MKHKSWAEIAQILERHQQSGLSLQKFAVREGLAFSTLQRWARKARLAAVKQNRPRLVELPNPFASASGGGSYRLHFPGGHVLEVACGFGADELRRLAGVIPQPMMPVGPATRIYLAAGVTDLRKSFEGLSDQVRHRFQEDPLSGHLFVFANRRKTRIKVLYWDGSGTWVCAKRLAKGCFSWPKTAENETGALRVLAEELTLLLSGIDLEKTSRREWWRRAA